METPAPNRTPFPLLLARFRDGDAAATEELLHRYTPVLREVVRQRLPQRMRGEFESLDFVQEVWAAMYGSRRPPNLETPEQLQAYLVATAVNRVVDALRHRSTLKCYTGTPDQTANSMTIGSEPTPSQWVMADERWEAIASHLPEGHLRVADRLRQGFTQDEISAMTGISIRAISRIVQQIRRECENATA